MRTIISLHFAAFTLPAFLVTEARTLHHDLLHRLGAARDALWIAALCDTLAECNRHAIFFGGGECAAGGSQHQPRQISVHDAGSGDGEEVEKFNS